MIKYLVQSANADWHKNIFLSRLDCYKTPFAPITLFHAHHHPLFFPSKKAPIPLTQGTSARLRTLRYHPNWSTKRPTHFMHLYACSLTNGRRSRWRLLCRSSSGHPPESIHHKLIYCTPTTGSSLRHQTLPLLFSVIGFSFISIDWFLW